MNIIKSVSVAMLMTALPFVSNAFTASDGEINVGEWNSRVTDIKKKADAENIPVIAVGTAFGCSHCANFYLVMQTAKFQNWVAKSPYLFCFCYSGTGHWLTGEQKAFADWFGVGALPRVGYYWKKKDGTIVGGKTTTFAGRGYSDQALIDMFERLFKDYSPDTTDEWDHTDDVKTGATELEATAAAAYTEVHTLNAGTDTPDNADWFKIQINEGTKYRVALEKFVPEVGDPTARIFDGEEEIWNGKASELKATPFVCVATNSSIYVCVATDAENTKCSYALAYREYEDVSFSLEHEAMSVDENAGKATFKVLRTGRLTDDVVVTVKTADGTGKAGENYVAFDETVTIPANTTEKTVSISINDIAGNQGDKTFTASIANPEDEGNAATVTITIIDLDVPTDAKDPDDNMRAGATQFVITDQTSSVKGQEQTSRVVSGQDVADWYVLQSMEAGKTYQVKVPKGSYSKRPATAASDPQVFFYVGGSEEPFNSQSLVSLMEEPYRFTAEESGDLVVLVTNEVADATVYTYDLAWQEWVLPVVSFTDTVATVVSAAGKDTTTTVTLSRTKNLEEAITVQVAVSVVEGRVAATTNKVSFAAGSDTATFTVPLLLDGGMWKPDETFTLTILDDAEVHQNAESAIHLQTVTLKTAMGEFDADDGDGNVNANAANATAIEVGKKPTTRSGLTLNGSDKDDWYSFPVDKDVEYVFELVDVLPESDEELPLSVEIQLPGENAATAVPLEDCIGAIYHFVPSAAGTVAIGIHKTADEPASLSYGLKYREWVPATIGFTQAEIEVSELASSVRIPVQCDMEVPLPVSIAVKTEDGTAVAGEDYVALDTTLEWTEESPTSSVQYAVVNLKKLASKYEGEFETFKVLLDFTQSDAIEGDLTEMTVKVLEGDAGSVGTFAIGGYAFDETTTYAYQAKAVAATCGDKVNVKLVRTGGDAGAVTATLTWNGGTAAPVVVDFADLETEKWVELTIPESEGAYVARQTLRVTLTTNVKTAKTKNAVLTFIVVDSDKTLADYGKDKANIPFTAAGNAWYQASDGAIRTKTLTAAKQSATLTASLKGSGVLSFKPNQTGDGELLVKAGGKVLEQQTSEGVVSVAIPSGTQRISVVFTAISAGAWVSLGEIQFTPDAAFCQTGTFNGEATVNTVRGAFTATVTIAGRLSGRITLPNNQTWTLTGVFADGVCNVVTLRNGRTVATGTAAIDTDGNMELYCEVVGAEVAAVASRNGWTDRPLTGVFAENKDMLGQTAELVDTESGETLAFKIDSRGQMRVAGKYMGKSVSLSTVPYVGDDGKLHAMLVIRNVENSLEVLVSLDDSGVLSVEMQN